MDLIRKPLTEKQKKFAEIYCNSHGLLSNTECAIEAGYAKDSAYQRSHELLNPEICPHVVNYIHEIEDDIKTKFSISKDSHMAELWRIREEAKNKNQTLVRLRAEELRGKLMGYYVEKKQQLNVNKTLNDMSEEELENRMNQIHKQYSHFIDLKEPEKQIINAEVRGDQKAAKYKKERKISVLLASHNMNEVKRLCNSVLMMKGGDIIDSGTPDDLIKKHGRTNLEEVFLELVRAKNEFN